MAVQHGAEPDTGYAKDTWTDNDNEGAENIDFVCFVCADGVSVYSVLYWMSARTGRVDSWNW